MTRERNPTEACDGCYFYRARVIGTLAGQKLGEYHDVYQGECRAALPEMSKTAHGRGIWPGVQTYDWCALYERAKVREATYQAAVDSGRVVEGVESATK